jgi:uncharacterized cupredoxin-like copper-binding protein
MCGIDGKRLLVLGIGAAALIIAGTACGGDDDDETGDGGEATTVAVALKEFEVLPDKDSVPAGSVTFRATNDGPDDPHELVVVKTDLAPDKLPTSDTGAADEEGTGVELIGEIEEFAVGGEEEATFDLTPGKYVLLCNVYDEDEAEAHYAEGMHTAFTVE